MGLHETFRRIRCLHIAGRPRLGGAPQRYQGTGRGASETSRAESESTRAKAETEGQAFRFGPRGNRPALVQSRFGFAGYFRPGQPLSYDLAHGEIETFPVRQGRTAVILAIVEPKCLFVQVPEQVERFYAHIGAVEATLQETPEVLHRVRVDIAANIFHGVVNHLMGVVSLQSVIGQKEVSVYRAPGFDVRPNFGLQGLLSAIRYNLRANLAATFNDAEDGGLILSARASNASGTRRGVHVARLAANERFIYFNLSRELAAVFSLHGEPDALKHEPSGLLADSSSTVDLITRNAVLTIGHHPHSQEPLIKRDRRIFKDSPSLDAELGMVMAGLALPNAARGHKANVNGTATGASDTFGPATGNQVVKAVIGICKVEDRFLECVRFGCHKPSMEQKV
jgi:hypothetical protein